MMRNCVVWITVLLFMWQAYSNSASAQTSKPNVVIILADDLGYGDVGCYNDQSRIPTPNIDRLATQGMRFTDAHTPSSVCTPTRYGLLTGRYCWRTKLSRSVLWPWDPPLIPEDRLTLPAMLQQVGYDTACIGKWHLGWDWPLVHPDDPNRYLTDEFNGYTIDRRHRESYGERVDWKRPTRGGPTERGFDKYFGDDVPNFPPYTFIENNRVTVVPTVGKPDSMFGHAGPASEDWDLSLVMPTITRRAVAYLDQRATSSESSTPFFLYVPLTAPHTPIAPAAEFSGKSKAGRYGDFVHQVDWTVGQILTALQRNGLADNTLVLFTSDNGSPQRNGLKMSGPTGSVKKEFGHDSSRPWRGMKADIWEAGHRVPMIARWPNRISPASVCDEPLVLTDLMRTMATLVDASIPESAAEDSFDMSSVLLGKSTSPIRDHLIHHSGNGIYAIRVGDWKLITGKGSGGFTRYQPPADAPKGQLYDLKNDPTESNNLYRQEPETVTRLRKQLEGYRKAGRTFPAN